MATIDRGFRWVDCTTNLCSLQLKDIASLLLEVNDNATNTFIQHIQRRLSMAKVISIPISVRSMLKWLSPYSELITTFVLLTKQKIGFELQHNDL